LNTKKTEGAIGPRGESSETGKKTLIRAVMGAKVYLYYTSEEGVQYPVKKRFPGVDKGIDASSKTVNRVDDLRRHGKVTQKPGLSVRGGRVAASQSLRQYGFGSQWVLVKLRNVAIDEGTGNQSRWPR